MNRVKWDDIKTDKELTFECPITGHGILLEFFEESYGPFLETLNGQDYESYITEFFEKSHINTNHWGFVDTDAKLDFYELCEEMGLGPDLQIIREGVEGDQLQESIRTKKMLSSDEQQKMLDEKRQAIDKQKALAEEHRKKKELSTDAKAEKIKTARQASLIKLNEQLANLTEGDPKRKTILEKISKIKDQLIEKI